MSLAGMNEVENMAANHENPKRVRKFLRKLKSSIIRTRCVRVVVNPQAREDHLDVFPSGLFSNANWSSIRCRTAAEVRSTLDSFRLVGRRIWSLHTSSHDFLNGAENVLASAGKYVEGEEEYSRKNICAYANLPKRTRIVRQMEIDEPFVVEFEDGDTFEIDAAMEPEFLMSMNRIPIEVADKRFWGVDPFYMFSDVIGKEVVAVEVETDRVDRMPWTDRALDQPEEVASAICLRFENGSQLKFSPYIDFLMVASQNRDGEVKSASWEAVRDGFVTYADVFFDKRSGFVSKSEMLYFGGKGARSAGGHRVMLAPGPGWHKAILTGREAFIAAYDASVLALSAGVNVPRRWKAVRELDLTHDEWETVLSGMDAILSSPAVSRASDSALVRNLCAEELKQNQTRKENSRVDDIEIVTRFVERQWKLLEDLRRWTRRALHGDTMLRIVGL